MRNRLTIVMLYFESPEMLGLQLSYWREYPKEIAESVQVLIVDDGSPNHPATEVLLNEVLPDFPVRLYRIKKNIIYNQAGAFNLAFTKVDDGWVLMTDMDHVIPADSMSKVLKTGLEKDTVYRFGRRKMINLVEWELCTRHLDSILITKAMFWKAKGFDETFTGYWNGVSEPFRKSLKRSCKQIIELSHIHLLLFEANIIPDSGNTTYGKKGSVYDIKMNKVLNHLRKITFSDYQPKKYMQFEWEQVM